MENVFFTHLWGLGLRVCFLSHMLSVCQLLFCCPPLLTFIFELDSFSKFSSPLSLLFVVRYHEC